MHYRGNTIFNILEFSTSRESRETIGERSQLCQFGIKPGEPGESRSHLLFHLLYSDCFISTAEQFINRLLFIENRLYLLPGVFQHDSIRANQGNRQTGNGSH